MTTITGKNEHDDVCESAHFVRFYTDDARLVEEVAGFVDGAFREDGIGIVIATPEHIAHLEKQLAGLAGGNPEEWLPERLIALDAADTLALFMVDGWPDEKRFNESVGAVVAKACSHGKQVAAFGEMVALLCEDGLYDAAIRLEQLWTALAKKQSFSLFCAYPWQLFQDAELTEKFRQVCAEHDHVCSHNHAALPKDDKDMHLRLAELEQTTLALQNEVARRRASEQLVKQREQELSDFMENAVEGLHRVGPDGQILWANQAELKMLGYSWEEYVGRHIAEFHVDAEVIDSILSKLCAGETLLDHPARLRCKDGSIKHVLIHSNGCFEDGKLKYTRCFTRDATERVALAQAYAEREVLLAELTQANRVKDEFLAMLGHELRNPLAPIINALELMRIRGDTATLREQEIIQRQADHMVRLVNDLMDISRITRGKIELEISRVALSSVLTRSIEMVSPLLEQRNHRLSIEVEPHLELNADPARLSQVVANLLTNAARYTKSGGHIHIAAHRGKTEKGTLEISVKDNGIGIPQDMLSHIFEIFFQGKRTIDRSEGGLGVGLTLVKNIVDLHGGTIEAKSDGKDKGSEFIVRLPLEQAAKQTADSDAAPVPCAGIPVVRRRIMIVDDNVAAADTLGQLLALNGYVVEVFHDALPALAAVERFKPEFAVLDIGLPILSGYELASKIKSSSDGQSCRLIALTGYGQDADKAKSLSVGFEQHLVKPLNTKQLIDLINAAPAS